MPIYRYHCSVCNRGRDLFKPLAELDRAEHCLNCNFSMNRQICAPAVIGDYPGYECPVSGEWIEGRRAHEENLKKHGCRVLETGEKEDFLRRKRASENAADEAFGEAAAAEVAAMPPEKQEKLANELSHGLDITFNREGT